MINICMVGTGRMAVAHTRALGAMDGVTLHTVINRRAEYAQTYADEYGYLASATSLDQALEQGGIDAVVVCTPNQLHYAQSAAALRAGCHVLCELPVTLSLDQAVNLGELADKLDLRMMTCHTERFEPGRIALAEMIARGDVKPRHIVAKFHMLRHGHMVTKQQHHGWYDNTLFHRGAHTVDAVMHLLGPHFAQNLSVNMSPRWEGTNEPLDWSLQWLALSPITGEEVMVTMSLSHNSPMGGHTYDVIADEGEWVCETGSLRDHEAVLAERDRRDVVRQDAEFVAAIREGRSASMDMPAVLPTMRVLQAAWDVYLARQP